MKKFSLFGDAGVADTVTLEIASCYDSSDTGGGANARIRAYDLTNATRKGEVWNELGYPCYKYRKLPDEVGGSIWVNSKR